MERDTIISLAKTVHSVEGQNNEDAAFIRLAASLDLGDISGETVDQVVAILGELLAEKTISKRTHDWLLDALEREEN